MTNPCKFGLNLSAKLQENNERKNNLVSQNCVCFQMPEKGFGSEVFLRFKYSIAKLSFSKTMFLQRELFLTMIYTINSSLLLAIPSKFLC